MGGGECGEVGGWGGGRGMRVGGRRRRSGEEGGGDWEEAIVE